VARHGDVIDDIKLVSTSWGFDPRLTLFCPSEPASFPEIGLFSTSDRSLITAPGKASFVLGIIKLFNSGILLNYAAMPQRKKGGVPELPFEIARERDLYQYVMFLNNSSQPVKQSRLMS